MSRETLALCVFLGMLASPPARGQDLPPPAARAVDYEKDVRPIFAKSCIKCHGEKASKGGLVLDQKADALQGGDNGPAIVPGQSDDSRLIRYVAGVEDTVMPPENAGKPLTPEQVGILRAWIDQGAKWPDNLSRRGGPSSNHWAFKPPVRPELPKVKDATRVRNPIDAFVLARLEKEGMKPSPEAERATLLRRLSLDLVGLPPTIAELNAFLADRSPDAFDKQVDRLLASPHYGERWARRWLDRARYADTNGYEKDRERSIWPYRDWVIDALNRDVPFDRFTVEQIAGDLLPNATLFQKVATWFHRNTMTNEEGGIDVEEFRFASVVDRVGTTGTVWLGLTVQCAQCHTHKFDPITHRDYYRFFALLNNVDEPELSVPDTAIEARRAAIAAEVAKLEAGRAEHFPVRDESDGWVVLSPKRLDSAEGAKLDATAEGTIVASGKVVEADSYRLEFPVPDGRFSAIRLETRSDPKAPEPGPGRTKHGNFVVTDLKAEAGGKPVAFSSASADIEQPDFPVALAIDGKAGNGWAIDDGSGRIREPHAAVFVFKETIDGGSSRRLALTIDQRYGGGHTLGRFRVALKKVEAVVDDPKAPESEKRERRIAAKQAEWERGRTAFAWSIAGPSRLFSKNHATLDLRPDGSVLARGDKPNNDVYEVELDGTIEGATALRLEVLPDPSLPDDGPGRAPLFSVGDFILTEIRIATVDGKDVKPVLIARATEDYSEAGHPAKLAIDGKADTGWTIKGGVGRPHAAVFEFREPVAKGAKLRVTLHQFGIHQTTIGRFRLATTSAKSPVSASGVPADVEAALLVPATARTKDQAAVVRNHYLSVAPELAAYNKRVDDLRRSIPRSPTTLVMEERSPAESRTTHIHKRGEFLQPTGPVRPGTPAFLPGLPSDAPANRLGLARWLVMAENPMTSRVQVNGMWQAFFGRGLVPTLDDFGTRSEPPPHPELLDWLATEFVRIGWSQKALHR
ncbi:MAG TPA: PSD1 and planctomycete cytochrome C domain-containing protein, partial [Isosphaeraceae bacterium]